MHSHRFEGQFPSVSSITVGCGQLHGRSRWLSLALIVMALFLVNCSGGSSSPPQAARLAVPVRVVTLAPGSIAGTLSYSGELQARDQVDLVALQSGRIKDIFVVEGQEVTLGTPLAQLETDTLKAQVRQAQANVDVAQSKLNAVLQGARPEQIASARAQVEAQRAKLDSMQLPEGGTVAVSQAGLAAVRNQASTDLTAAQATLASAQASQSSSEAKLNQLLHPTLGDITSAQSALQSATSSLNSANERLERIHNPTEDDLLAAQAVVNGAQAGLKAAQAKLDDLKLTPKPQDVAAARAAVVNAQTLVYVAESNLAAMKQLLNKVKLQNLIDAYSELLAARGQLAFDQSRSAPLVVIIADEERVILALRQLQMAEEDADTFRTGVTLEQLLAATSALEAAKSGHASAQARFDQLMAGPSANDMQQAQSGVDQARASLQSTHARLSQLTYPTASDIAAAQNAVDQSDAQRVAAQVRLDTLQRPTPSDVQAAQSAVDSSRSSVQSAQARLDQLQGGGTAAAIANAQAAVANAQASVALQQAQSTQAEQQLALAQSQYTANDIDSATASVAQALAALDLAQVQLKNATLVAPFDAIVAKRNLARGALVTAQAAVFRLVSKPSQLVFNVEEAGRSRLKVGQPVTFSVSSFSNTKFGGKVAYIAPTADTSTRTFQVTVTPEQGSEALSPGIFATLTITIEQKQGVLVVPQAALIQQGESTIAYVVNDGKAEQRKVSLGLKSDSLVEVTSGLAAGDQVIVQGNQGLQPGATVTVASQGGGGAGGQRGAGAGGDQQARPGG
ncbi:MAG: efflux RND transporter periplasmic adaptor subunit [Dehalococcoidia bacterium]|nr:efflux RND transporter periplasmic adaptor subunit [Dehalococcoidia bacterium]